MKYDKETRNRLKGEVEKQRLLVRKMKKARRYSKARSKWKSVLAKSMRDFPTPCEQLVKTTMHQMGFIHQPVVHGYIPDFANFDHRVIVEIDGSVHKNPQNKISDLLKDERLKAHYWKILRFTNQEVMKHPEKVYEAVRGAITR